MVTRNTIRSSEEEGEGASPILITVKQEVRNIYTCHLDDVLDAPSKYRDLFSIMQGMTENDEMHFMINAPGGRLDTCAQIVNLIKETNGLVVGHLLGPSASAHSFIFLACHSWLVYPHSSVMAHCYSGGVFEKGPEIIKSAKATEIFFDELVTDIYYPFFNEEEIAQILDNKDIHIHSKDIGPRLDVLYDYRKAEIERSANAQKELIKQSFMLADKE